MSKTRLEAFSDGVVAILITIMVLEFRVPGGADWSALAPLLPKFLAYVMSFIFIGIYWTNHHHLIHATREVSGGILWANLHLLFWLSLVPFATAWLGEHYSESVPTAVYGTVLLFDAISYSILVRVIFAHEGPQSKLRAALGSDTKGNVSLVLYIAALPLAFIKPAIADVIFVSVAISWLVPDRRIERKVFRT